MLFNTQIIFRGVFVYYFAVHSLDFALGCDFYVYRVSVVWPAPKFIIGKQVHQVSPCDFLDMRVFDFVDEVLVLGIILKGVANR